jgi:DNA polymerase-1
MSKQRLFIIDTMAMAFRTFYAIRSLSTSSGQPVNAVYGSLLFLWGLIEKERPDYLVFATDSKEQTFRHKLYEAYKANRKEMPEELAAQIPLLFRLFQAMQAPILKEPGLEADDLIGSLAVQKASPHMHVYIVSGDKDFMQLVGPHISLLQPKKGGENAVVELQGVFDKFGCKPEQVIDILALMGDASDNVPGVHGIGDKGAAKLIQEFHSLDGIYANLDKISNKRQRETLETHRDMAFLSKQLVTIHTEHKLEHDLEELRCNPDTALGNPELLALMEELEFKQYIDKVRKRLQSLPATAQLTPSQEAERAAHNYQVVRTEAELKNFVELMSQADAISFDTETTGLDRCSDVPIGASFSVESGEAYYLPLHESHRLVPEERVKAVISEVLNRPGVLKVGHNQKFDLQMLANIGIKVEGPLADTMMAAYLIDPIERSHGLDDCCLRYLHYRKIPTSELLDAKGSMLNAPLEKLTEYACEDADYTLRLYKALRPKLEAMELTTIYETIEMPLVPILAKMEHRGINVDTEILSEISNKLAEQAASLEKEIYKEAGESFNINSPKQLQVILFEKLKIHELLGLKRIKKTKSGYSTDVSVLEQMEGHPLPKALLNYRMVTKLKNTYVDSLPQLIHSGTTRIHTHFHQTGTATGRLSSSDPNMQNIPIRSEAGREIRKAFRPSQKDWVIVSADYSQIELRILAALAADENLKDAFAQGLDIHTATAAKILGVSPAEVTPNQRSQAKAINFGIIYGMGPQRLARETGVSMKEAKEFIDRYFTSYPKIRSYIEKSIHFAREHEYTRTLLGRRRPLKEINNSQDGAGLANAQNIAVNSPVQGSAADLIKKAMILVQKKLEESPYHAKMLLQVHDELVFECPRTEVEPVMRLIKDEMEHAMDLGVPLKVEVGFGDNWLEAH